MQANPMWLEVCWHSLGIYMVVSPNTGTDIPHGVLCVVHADSFVMQQ
jgi:hypothetical protein